MVLISIVRWGYKPTNITFGGPTLYSWLANTSATTEIVGSLGSVYPMAGTDGNRGMVVGLAGALWGISFLTNDNRQSTDSENEGRFNGFFLWGQALVNKSLNGNHHV